MSKIETVSLTKLHDLITKELEAEREEIVRHLPHTD